MGIAIHDGELRRWRENLERDLDKHRAKGLPTDDIIKSSNRLSKRRVSRGGGSARPATGVQVAGRLGPGRYEYRNGLWYKIG